MPAQARGGDPALRLCKCHGEPMYRNNSVGGWRCRVKVLQRQRDRYDADPIYRISKNLHDHARRRADNLKRQREALVGALPHEG